MSVYQSFAHRFFYFSSSGIKTQHLDVLTSLYSNITNHDESIRATVLEDIVQRPEQRKHEKKAGSHTPM